MCALIVQAYGLTATLKKAVSAFRDAEIWPIDTQTFNENDFIPSTILNSSVETQDSIMDSSYEDDIGSEEKDKNSGSLLFFFEFFYQRKLSFVTK